LKEDWGIHFAGVRKMAVLNFPAGERGRQGGTWEQFGSQAAVGLLANKFKD
jgi:hypothetical protein